MINDQTTFGVGVFPDITILEHQAPGDILRRTVYVAYRVGDPRYPGTMDVIAFPDTDLGIRTLIFQAPLGEGSPSYPRLWTLDGHAYLAYQHGALVRLHELTNLALAWEVPCYGSNPCCFGGQWLAVQTAPDYTITRYNLRTKERVTMGGGAPTGLSRVADDGTVINMDADRYSLPGASIPCYAGDLAVGESGYGGVFWRLPGLTGTIWPGLICYQPRCATTSVPVAIVTAGPEVRTFVGTRDELATFLAPPIDVVVPPVQKPLWLNWFEFEPPPASYVCAPGNAQLRIYDGAHITRLDGSQFAQWVQDHSVEGIEAQCAASPWPCVAYWDARTWPRWPVLKPTDWLALQWYCFADEAPDAFEANMRAVLSTVPPQYRQIAGVAQAFTSNTGLTPNLPGLVPVFSRLAAGDARVTMLVPFSDYGRATGLCDQPSETRACWQTLADSITGEPPMEGG